MNKKIILALLCAFIAVGVVAQSTPNAQNVEFYGLGVYSTPMVESTAGTMKSDADLITTADIFDIDQTFFSAGIKKGVVNGVWAMPVDSLDMTFGVAGEYTMDGTRVDTSTEGGTVNTQDLPLGTVFTKKETIEESNFAVKAVVRWTELSFSYAIKRLGTNTNTFERGVVTDVNEDIISHEVDATGSYWQHELGYGHNLTNFLQLNVPLGLVFKNSKTETSTMDALLAPNVTVNTHIKDYTARGEDAVTLYTNPSVEIYTGFGPLAFLSEIMTPLEKFDAGLMFAVDVYNPEDEKITVVRKEGSDISASDEAETVDETLFSERADFSLGIFLKPRFEWATWENKIDFIVEPRVQLGYQRKVAGVTTTSTTITTVDGKVSSTSVVDKSTVKNNYINPQVGANVGLAIRPKEFFELRAGLAYTFDWKTNPHTVVTTNGAELPGYDYDSDSTFGAMLGCGFMFGENVTFDLNMDFSSDSDVFDLDNFTTIQLTYRF